MRYKPLTQDYINSLPQQVIATNFMGQNIPKNMVADASGQVTPQVAYQPPDQQKQQTIGSILGDLANKLGPSEAAAEEPPKKGVWQDYDESKWNDVEESAAQPDLSMGQKIVRGALPYVELPLQAAGAIGGGIIGSGIGPEGTIAGGALGYGIAKGAIDKAKEYAGMIQPAKDLPEATNRAAEDIKSGLEMSLMGEIGGELTSKALSWLANRAAPGLYERVMKFSTVGAKGLDRERAVTEGLKQGYGPNLKSVENLKAAKESLEKQIDGIITEAARNGKTVETSKVLQVLDDFAKYHKNALDPRKLLQEIAEQKKGILEYRGDTMPIDAAHEAKVYLHTQLKKAYGDMKNFDIEFDKSIARGLRQVIEQQIPEVAALNKQLGDKLNLEKALQQAANRVRNHDMVSLTDWIIGGMAGGVGALHGGGVEGFGTMLAAGMLKKIFTSPNVQGKLAIYMSKLSPASAAKLAQLTAVGATEQATNRRAEQSFTPSFAH